jgi:acyl-coenzyme A synthetase/AMP-(fatty) acid ligase
MIQVLILVAGSVWSNGPSVCELEMNIVEPIFVHCRSKPAEIALAAPGTEFNVVSYGRLARSVNNVCQRLISAGLGPRNRVAVFLDDPVFHAIMLIALTRLGVVTISGKGKDSSWRFQANAIIADKPFPSQIARIMLADTSWTSGDGRPIAREHIYQGSPDEVCRIMLTSGTTGEDKAVAVTNRIMAARIDRQNVFFGSRAAFCSRTYVDLSLTTSLGFQSLIATLWRGGALFLAGDPQQTVSAFPVYGVQNMIASPGGLLGLLGAMERRPEYQCGFEAVFSVGSILTHSLSERVRARVCSNLTKGYGSTEATMVASMPAHFAPDLSGAVGFVLPGINVQIVDEGGAPLPRGKDGIIRINSDYGVREYLDDPEESARVFRDGWFYPGDLGHLTEQNMLVISGRTKTVINIGGEKVTPERVEEVLSAHPSVQQVAVLAVPNESGVDDVCALVVPHSALSAQVLKAFCSERLPPKFVPARFIAVTDLPRNEMGKIERLKLFDLVKSKLN